MVFDLETGGMRNWYIGADGVKRWADTEEPVEGESSGRYGDDE
jgi:hypothetical protein